MGKRKDPNQKGSGAKKHRRNYRARFQEKFRSESPATRYRLRHAIPAGSRQSNHRQDACPVHRRIAKR